MKLLATVCIVLRGFLTNGTPRTVGGKSAPDFVSCALTYMAASGVPARVVGSSSVLLDAGTPPPPFTMLDPLPPDHIPTNPPVVKLRPAPAMPETSWTAKPVLKSRTIWSIIATIVGFILAKFFGIDGVDIGAAIGDDGILNVGELIWLVGALFAAWFRKNATGPLTTTG